MATYKAIIEVARHGARAPSIVYDLAADGTSGFDTPMEMTQLGAEQHQKLGQYVKERYFDSQMAGAELKPMVKGQANTVYGQSTDKNRTKQSLTS